MDNVLMGFGRARSQSPRPNSHDFHNGLLQFCCLAQSCLSSLGFLAAKIWFRLFRAKVCLGNSGLEKLALG